jgi:hypothetical protein
MKKLIVLSESDEYNPSITIRYLNTNLSKNKKLKIK